MAGVSRLQYTNEIRLIRVMCSGRVDPEFVFRAFANRVDGVFIGGCRLGECNYITHGNFHALNMTLLCKRILEQVGLDPNRLRIAFMSSGEGLIFTQVVDDFVQEIKALGPLGAGEGLELSDLKPRIDEVRNLVPYIKMVKRDKLAARLQSEDEYDAHFTREEIDALFDEVVSYYIDPEKCRACMICLRRCPVEAIKGGKNQIHVIDQQKCIKCGTCFDVCPSKFSAVTEFVGKPAPPPIPENERMIERKKV